MLRFAHAIEEASPHAVSVMPSACAAALSLRSRVASGRCCRIDSSRYIASYAVSPCVLASRRRESLSGAWSRWTPSASIARTAAAVSSCVKRPFRSAMTNALRTSTHHNAGATPPIAVTSSRIASACVDGSSPSTHAMVTELSRTGAFNAGLHSSSGEFPRSSPIQDACVCRGGFGPRS